jgi:hypothetical protein
MIIEKSNEASTKHCCKLKCATKKYDNTNQQLDKKKLRLGWPANETKSKAER